MSTAPNPVGTVKKSLVWSIVLSILLILAGIAAIILPPVASLAVTIFVGWMLVLSGIIHFVYAWKTRHTGGVLWEVLIGVVYVAAGAYLLWNPIVGLAAVTLALALYLLFEGLLEFVLSYQLRPAPGSGWLLFDGIITLILALLIWRIWPIGAPWILGLLVGISMLVSGTARLMLTVAARRMLNQVV
jgi:uncharacterized membrane protein HdeD (DUF308 family)